ncbi:hypothetical protein M513_02361 [Trichuris suis]|uniref:Cathepsin L-like n=1 Tax=Trichuris suis TaxID=68888 RepID=A0A085MHI9_9BILA|nr:hypothetical protein M513_02361 [Trichuris suis]
MTGGQQIGKQPQKRSSNRNEAKVETQEPAFLAVLTKLQYDSWAANRKDPRSLYEGFTGVLFSVTKKGGKGHSSFYNIYQAVNFDRSGRSTAAVHVQAHARVVLYLPLVFLLGALSAVILIYKCSELWYPSEIVYVPKDEYSGSMTNRARVQAYTVVDSLYIDDQDSYTLLEVMFRKMLSFLPHKTNRRHGIQNALLLLLWDNFKVDFRFMNADCARGLGSKFHVFCLSEIQFEAIQCQGHCVLEERTIWSNVVMCQRPLQGRERLHVAFDSSLDKTYQTFADESHHYETFLLNYLKIVKHNVQFKAGRESYQLRMNSFGDMTYSEFISTMNGYKRSTGGLKRDAKIYAPQPVSSAPKNIDWRKLGLVTPVKDQKACGSCWAFSATGSLEGQHMRKYGSLVSLSEQNLVDCSSKFGNMGCNGGLMEQAFEYIKSNGGIDTEKSYPYEGIDGKCRFNNATIGATDHGYVDIMKDNETALMLAVANVGPVSVAIDASQESFQFYHKGVYYERKCSTETLNHGVLVVGYGSSNRMDYWIVKNSWGTGWGDKGYILMARNKRNNCGIASAASYPLV